MRKLTTIGSTVVASLLLIGCGGGASSTSTPSTGTGFYVDAAVMGADYVCGSQSGVTGAKGNFTFEKNRNCTFSLGGLKLREVNATSLQEGITILEDNPDVARLLQTMDRDGNATNGIEISEESKKTIKLTSVPKEDAVLNSISDDIKANDDKYRGRVPTVEESQSHLNQTRTEIKNDGRATQYTMDTSTTTKTTTAYFGDKENNLIVVVDVDNMQVIKNIATGHEKSYAAEVVKTKANHELANPKMYVDNRGSNTIDVIDSATNTF